MRTLQEWWKETDVFVTIKEGDVVLYTNEDLWPRLFNDQKLDMYAAKGVWQGAPQITLYFKIAQFASVKIDFTSITFKRNGKVWYHSDQKLQPLTIEHADDLRFTITLREHWNGT